MVLVAAGCGIPTVHSAVEVAPVTVTGVMMGWGYNHTRPGLGQSYSARTRSDSSRAAAAARRRSRSCQCPTATSFCKFKSEMILSPSHL